MRIAMTFEALTEILKVNGDISLNQEVTGITVVCGGIDVDIETVTEAPTAVTELGPDDTREAVNHRLSTTMKKHN